MGGKGGEGREGWKQWGVGSGSGAAPGRGRKPSTLSDCGIPKEFVGDVSVGKADGRRRAVGQGEGGERHL